MASSVNTAVAAASSANVVKSSISYVLEDDLTNLTLIGTADIDGTGNSLANILIGNIGANRLYGGGGVDLLNGGKGNDTYVVDLIKSGSGTTAAAALQDKIKESAKQGSDTLILTGSVNDLDNATTLTLGANLEHLDASGTGATKLNLTGNALANTLTGNDASNVLDGGKGVDILMGGLGNDTYLVDNAADSITEGVDGGTDLARIRIAKAGGTYALAANVENGMLTNTVSFNLTGNDLANLLTGNAAVNILTGGNGADILDGQGGADILIGGAGNDSYFVDKAGDRITEDTDAGTDSVQASVSYTLGANVENLTLTGTGAINGAGNDLDNGLTGNDGANLLDGGAGADNMVGGKGNDIYVVDNAGDIVTESLTQVQGGGVDLVKSSVSYVLGGNLDNLTLTGAGAIDGTGNAFANTLIGNDGPNRLYGGGDKDILQGGLGDDLLDGGADSDILTGGAGDDTYIVDLVLLQHYSNSYYYLALEDIIVEDKAAGVDTLILRGDGPGGGSIQLNENLENLDASNVVRIDGSSSAGINLRGNSLDNIIIGSKDGSDPGNSQGNWISGGAGNDTLIGGAGEDHLSGEAGYDTLIGGEGSDYYYLANEQDVIYEAGGIGADVIWANFSIDLNHYVGIENVYLYAYDGFNYIYSALNITGDSHDNGLLGNYGNNTIVGGAGNDTLIGSLGNDILIGGEGIDVLIGGTGSDIFKFNAISEVSSQQDDIYDFNSSEGDKMDFTALEAHEGQSLTFIGSSAFNGTAGQFRYEADLLTGDINGDGAIDFGIKLLGVGALTSSDFIL